MGLEPFSSFLFPIQDYNEITASQRNDRYILIELIYLSCSPVIPFSTIAHICRRAFCNYCHLLTDVFFQRATTEILFGRAGNDTKIEAEITFRHRSFQNTSENNSVPSGFSLHTAAGCFQRWSGTFWVVLLEFSTCNWSLIWGTLERQ